MLITGTHTHVLTDQLLKMGFSYSVDLKKCKSIKISIPKICPENNNGLEKVKKVPTNENAAIDH